jgi:hypothetical protein
MGTFRIFPLENISFFWKLFPAVSLNVKCGSGGTRPNDISPMKMKLPQCLVKHHVKNEYEANADPRILNLGTGYSYTPQSLYPRYPLHLSLPENFQEAEAASFRGGGGSAFFSSDF